MNTKRNCDGAIERKYRYRFPGQPEWEYVWCCSLKEAREIVRMKRTDFRCDSKLPNGTIIERAPAE